MRTGCLKFRHFHYTHVTTCTKFNGPAVNSRANSLHFHWQNESLFFSEEIIFSPSNTIHTTVLLSFFLNPTVPMCRERNGVMFN